MDFLPGRRFLLACVGAFVLLSGLPLAVASAAPSGSPVRIGRAPHPPNSRVVGSLAGGTPLQITVTLKPRDPLALQNFATAVSTPGSSVYHHYLTVGEFRERFGPTSSEVAAVEASLRAHGLRPGAVSANGLAIPVSAPATSIARAFSLSFQRLQLRSGRVAFANTLPPQFDSSVAPTVQGVIGLDNIAHAQPLVVHASTAGRRSGRVQPHVVTGGPQPCSAASSDAGLNGAYTADQLASAYDFNGFYSASDEGSGQTVALFELASYASSDISNYQSCYSTSASVSNVTVDGGSGSPDSDSIEDVLDIEDVIGLAPQASIHVYEGPNTDNGVYDTYNQIVTDDTAQVISTSWGECEEQMPTSGSDTPAAENTLFQEAASQGQSVFAAAGDSGSDDCQSGSPAVDDPASQPYVTGVGGTSLSAVGPPPTESVWNDGSGSPGGAGGGGVSSLWPMPNYQSSAPSGLGVINKTYSSGTPCRAPSGSYCREVPDVSADADELTGYEIYYGGWTQVGGTSAAAPLWAALTALTNASSACGTTPVGFANPLLYQAAGSAYSSDFNDITSGSNDMDGLGVYPAGTGYDMASGLGTPVGSALASTLCGESRPNVITIANPGDQTSAINAPASLQIDGQDSDHAQTLTYTATGLPSGLTINHSTGLINGTPSTLQTTAVTVTAKDGTGASDSRSFTWTISKRATSTTFTCGPPSTVDVGAGTTCAATVADTDGGSPTAPHGTVTFSPSVGGSLSCNLPNPGANPNSCQVSYTPVAIAETLTATYNGDATHQTSSSSGSGGLTILGPPSAAFSYSPSSPIFGTGVSFDASGSSDPNSGGSLSDSWNFGDGSSGSGSSVSHSFSPGSYTVTLTVTDSLSHLNSSTSRVVNVALDPPTASFAAPSGHAGRPVAFNGSGSDPGSITTYEWSFGDGGSGSGPDPSHSYSHAGTYEVTLIVFDNRGLTASVSHAVTIYSPLCVVPNLTGKTLAQARRAAAASNCAIGKVKAPHQKPNHSPGQNKKWQLRVSIQRMPPGSLWGDNAAIKLVLVYRAVRR